MARTIAPPPMLVLDVDDLDQTLALGRKLGAALSPGDVVALEGTLGAGKTNLVRGIAEGLGVPDSRIVSSPTFVLIQEYPARLPIYHFDAYRLSRLEDFLDLGVHEYFSGDGVCLVEWADKVAAALPAEHLWIRLEITGPTSRRFTFLPHGLRYERIIVHLASTSR